MQVAKQDIIGRIRIILNEIGLNDSEFEGGADERNLDKMVEEFALEALRFVNLNAPYELLEADAVLTSEDEKFKTSAGVIEGTYIGEFDTVEKFLRLLCVRSSSWHKPVFEAVKEDTPAAQMLRNKYLTGTVENPKVLVGKSPVVANLAQYARTCIRMYCIPKTDSYVEVFYMTQPEWLESNKMRISYLAQDAFYYYLAYLVLMAMGDARAATMLQQALPLMGLKNTSDG